MSLEDLGKKVLASAQNEAKEIVGKAEAQAKAELERRANALREEQQRKIALGEADADAALERDITSRRAEHGMKILQAKNDILDAIFAQAQERILASEGFDYAAWLAEQIRQALAAGSGVLHCNQRDRAAVEAVLRQAGTHEVALAPEDASIQGGVLLTADAFDLDFTLEAALADLRQELTVSLAERLFADVAPIGIAAAEHGD